MLMDMYLAKFDIHQGKLAPSCFKSHTNSRCPDFFQKKKFCLTTGLKITFSDIPSFLSDNLPRSKKHYIPAWSFTVIQRVPGKSVRYYKVAMCPPYSMSAMDKFDCSTKIKT